eukprot:TRINITY_DN27433_c0_g1_i1.p1 TRINITY_DN27433_c0_g1~~TRINITY_DN27433_c0_g1_i1.p1  ORF type:complete len:526 (+),score=98.40 TRINITY_DN27433_c0_g1_i1:96-1673(+)
MQLPGFHSTIAAAALPVCLLLLALKRQRRSKRLPPPPCPPAHWLFGHVHLFPDVSDPQAPHIDVFLMEWVKTHGWKVFSFITPLLGRFVVVADPALVRQALVVENYRKSPTYMFMEPFIGKTSMIMAEGAEWSEKRRHFNPGFAPKFLRGVVSTIAQKACLLCDRCRQAAESGDELLLHPAAIDFTADVIANVAFGEDWACQETADAASSSISLQDKDKLSSQARMRDLMFKLQWECTQNQITPWRAFFNLSSMFRIRRMRKQLDADMAALVNHRIEMLAKEDSVDAPQRHDILSLALRQRKAWSSHAVSDVVCQMKTFFFAGHDTTSTLIAWTVWLLAQHPDVCAKVRLEVAQELGTWGSGKAADIDAVAPSYEELQRCEFLEAVIMETLRLYPPAATARYVDDPDATFGGYGIGGCFLYVSQYILHRHPDLWDEPDVFRPERFLKENLKDDSPAANPFMFGPFSRGPRDCIGKYFAILEGKLAVAALASMFDFTAVHSDEGPAYRVTQRPAKGVCVRVQHLQK